MVRRLSHKIILEIINRTDATHRIHWFKTAPFGLVKVANKSGYLINSPSGLRIYIYPLAAISFPVFEYIK